jgi:hypothetical protein
LAWQTGRGRAAVAELEGVTWRDLRDEASLPLTERVNSRSGDQQRADQFVEHSANPANRCWARFLDLF